MVDTASSDIPIGQDSVHVRELNTPLWEFKHLKMLSVSQADTKRPELPCFVSPFCRQSSHCANIGRRGISLIGIECSFNQTGADEEFLSPLFFCLTTILAGVQRF